MLPNPIILFGNFKVHMYGIMIAVGLLFTFIVLFTYSKKLKVHPSFTDFVYYNALFSIFAGFASAALFQSTYDFIANPEAGFQFKGTDGGITFIGGLIGGSVAFLIVYAIFRKRLKGKLTDSLSIIPCGILIAHAFGRIGCFFAGCCYGKETDCFIGVQFPEMDAKVHPTQLYEAAFLFILFAVCSYLVLRKGFKHNMSVYLVCYGIFRFLIEFVRDDDRGELVGFVTPSQFWSLLMIVIGVGLYFYLEKAVFPKQRALESEAAESEN